MFGKNDGKDAYRARHKVEVSPKYSSFGVKSAMVGSLFALGVPTANASILSIGSENPDLKLSPLVYNDATSIDLLGDYTPDHAEATDIDFIGNETPGRSELVANDATDIYNLDSETPGRDYLVNNDATNIENIGSETPERLEMADTTANNVENIGATAPVRGANLGNHREARSIAELDATPYETVAWNETLSAAEDEEIWGSFHTSSGGKLDVTVTDKPAAGDATLIGAIDSYTPDHAEATDIDFIGNETPGRSELVANDATDIYNLDSETPGRDYLVNNDATNIENIGSETPERLEMADTTANNVENIGATAPVRGANLGNHREARSIAELDATPYETVAWNETLSAAEDEEIWGSFHTGSGGKLDVTVTDKPAAGDATVLPKDAAGSSLTGALEYPKLTGLSDFGTPVNEADTKDRLGLPATLPATENGSEFRGALEYPKLAGYSAIGTNVNEADTKDQPGTAAVLPKSAAGATFAGKLEYPEIAGVKDFGLSASGADAKNKPNTPVLDSTAAAAELPQTGADQRGGLLGAAALVLAGVASIFGSRKRRQD
ncbi:LPXTG-motif cell wall-anchored protein [Arcanobacterium hippocoleae]|uniref:LPXTG-motif cell wall-anchored protein n=1 Tax=Arcanobacterium hippocoleae TaxID=149017 RepID=A0ABU1T002_9ACTO|nr:LPXTG cell wall anchor domain-containing protein [Arcanobacterium hippocoleae]MDR6938721.1 LPXTG-motif cell wall-anchored protein [Arcanobacterium hippocoleae]